MNEGDASYTELKETTGVLTNPMVARGAAYGDYDLDGDLDILIMENKGPAHLWRNETSGGGFLRVRVEGTVSNRDGIGTKITAVVDGLRMERRVRSGSSYLSESERVVTFGLGGHAGVDSLVLRWPGGRVDRFADVPGNRQIRVVEGTGRLELEDPPAVRATAAN